MRWRELPDGEFGTYREHAPVKAGDEVETFDGRAIVVGWVNPFGVPVAGDPAAAPAGDYLNVWFRILKRAA